MGAWRLARLLRRYERTLVHHLENAARLAAQGDETGARESIAAANIVHHGISRLLQDHGITPHGRGRGSRASGSAFSGTPGHAPCEETYCLDSAWPHCGVDIETWPCRASRGL